MSNAEAEVVRAFFVAIAQAPAACDIRIDVLDGWTTSDLSAVRPTTVSRGLGSGTADPGR